MREIYYSVDFNLGLASIRFQTTRPCLQQVNLTRARDEIEKQHVVSCPFKKYVTSIISELEPVI